MDSNALRSALRERVARKVAGKGVDSSSIDRAVDAVVRALPADVIQDTEQASARGDGAVSEVVLAVAAPSVPDLASRVRRALVGAGVPVIETGSGTAGRHTVITVRLPGTASDLARRTAEANGWRVSNVQ